MTISKFGSSLMSIILALLVMVQSLYVPAHNPPAGSNTIQLISAANTSGNPDSIHIVFSEPIRFADDNPSAHIFASSSGTPASDKNGWNIALSDSDSSCVAMDPVMIAGKVYASEYSLVFADDIARTGVIRIIGEPSSRKSADVASICDASGNTLKTDVKSSKKNPAAATGQSSIFLNI